MAGGIVTINADEILSSPVHVINATFVVCGNDPLSNGLECELRLPLASRQRHFEALAMADIPSDGQYRGPSVKFDQR